MKSTTGPLLVLLVLLGAVVACDAGDESDVAETDDAGDADTDTDTAAGSGDETGTDSGVAEVVCDEQPVVTYDTFGRGFLATYCDGCHGPDVANRQGAPTAATFQSRQQALDLAEQILARSAPDDGSAPSMPPAGGVTPSDVERLRVWLMCWP